MHAWGMAVIATNADPFNSAKAGASEQEGMRTNVYVMQLLCAMMSESASPSRKWGGGGGSCQVGLHSLCGLTGQRRGTCIHAFTWLV